MKFFPSLLAVALVHLLLAPGGAAEGTWAAEDDVSRPKNASLVASVGKKGKAGGKRVVLEDFTPFSKSHMWKLMFEFYAKKGVDAFTQGIVPSFVTTNAFIGRSYARVVHGFLRDLAAGRAVGGGMALDPTEPLYIVELGTGHGKFSFYMLKAMLEIWEEFSEAGDDNVFPADKIVFVMTDFAETNFNFWTDHPKLRPFVESGQLDMAIFDADRDDTMTLARSGVVLVPGTVKNPICIVANYLFDSLLSDAFQVTPDGHIMEGLVSVGSNREEPNLLDPRIIKRMDNRWKYRNATEDFYADEDGDEVHFKHVLQSYVDYSKQHQEGVSIIFPAGPLRAVRVLMRFSDNRALLISGDKGAVNKAQQRGLTDPYIDIHGSWSVNVNFDAIGTYFNSRGGFALHSPREDVDLHTSVFVLTGGQEDEAWTTEAVDRTSVERARRFPRLSEAYRDAIVRSGPEQISDIYVWMRKGETKPPISIIMALLQMGDWDPEVFSDFITTFNKDYKSNDVMDRDLGRGLERVWENYYPLDEGDEEMAYWIGDIYMHIDCERANWFFNKSLEVREGHNALLNMGLCYQEMGDLHEALEHLSRAIKIKPGFKSAKRHRKAVLEELTNGRCSRS